MHPLNWVIVVGWLTYVVIHGIRKSKGTGDIEGYLMANRSLPWWSVGLSVMATQLSAVTMIGTTGQGATDGMRFVQFYFEPPLEKFVRGVHAGAVQKRHERHPHRALHRSWQAILPAR
jgi:Na+/proline symporter